MSSRVEQVFMSFGFPAYSLASQRFNIGQPDLINIISEALSRLGWSYTCPQINIFIAKVPMTVWSWGETVTVNISEDGLAIVKSKGNLVTQCIDWGENRRNVNEFFQKVSQIISISGAHRTQPRPYDQEMQTPIERVINMATDTQKSRLNCQRFC